MGRLGKILILLAAISPAALPMWIIITKGVDYPPSDHWDDFGVFLLDVIHHQLTFADLVAQTNEHRLIMPRLVYLTISYAHWHPVREMLLDLVVCCITSGCVLLLLHQTFDLPRRLNISTASLWLVCNIAIFSPQQWESWLFPALCLMLPMTFILTGIIVTRSSLSPWKKILLCIFLAAAATYSFGNGMIAWPILGVALIIRIKTTSRVRMIATAVWTVAAVAVCGSYFIGYSKPGFGSSNPYSHDYRRSAIYALYFLGNLARSAIPPNWPDVNSLPAGITFLSLYLICAGYALWIWLKRGDTVLFGKMLIWLAVGSYSIGSAIVTGLTRVGFAIDHAAYTSRYVTTSLWLPISLVALAVLILPLSLRWIFSALLVAAVVVGYPAEIGNAASYSQMNRQGAAALLLRKALPDNPMLKINYFNDRARLFELADGLTACGNLQWPTIPSTRPTDLLSDNPAAMAGVMDNGGTFGNDAVSFSGWAMNLRRNQPADAVFICYNDSENNPVLIAQAKMDSWHDPADPYKSITGGASGWHIIIPSNLFPAGMDKATITAWAMDIETGKLTQLKGVKVMALPKPIS